MQTLQSLEPDGTRRKVHLQGLNEHQTNDMPIADVGAVITTNKGLAIAIFNQCAHQGMGKAAHSSCQIEWNGHGVNDKSVRVKNGLQRICAACGCVIPHNCKEACSIRTTLEEMGHPQPPTPIGADNNAAAGVANNSIKRKRSKAVDMHFCWTHDQAQQGQFHIAWCKGAFNKADHFSKHHPTVPHRDLWSAHPRELPSRNSNCFDCPRDDNDNNDSDAITTTDDSASNTLHAQPKASRSSAAPAGEGVLIPPRRPHQSRHLCLHTVLNLRADL
jgi:hypothetical protein